MLTIERRPWDRSVLRDAAGVLVTSGNGAVALVTGRDVSRDLPVLAVGPATAEPLRAAGFRHAEHGAGTAEDLLRLVRRRFEPNHGPLVRLGAAILSRDFGRDLRSASYEARRVVMYDAVPARTLPPTFVQACEPAGSVSRCSTRPAPRPPSATSFAPPVSRERSHP